ncbi:MAG: ACP S-malonyltransferase [Bdellovibrionales bacterium]
MKAFIFPGQGSQTVGMGKEMAGAFTVARDVFAEVDDALGQKLSTLMFEGPAEDLQLTANAQPAIMAASMAVLRVLQREGGLNLATAASYVAGHSLGEYSALCAAETFALADTARLLRTRGDAMQAAVPVGVGAMAALIGAEFAQAEEIAAEAAQGEVCTAANDNAPGQVVISGHKTAIDRAIAIAAEKGLKRAMLLPVSAPFHCALMQPAADVMQQALSIVQMKAPVVPVLANVTAAPASKVDEIRNLLVQQVCGTVRWRESILKLKELGVTQLVEIGQGTVLAGLAKRIDKELPCISIQGPADVEAFLKSAEAA